MTSFLTVIQLIMVFVSFYVFPHTFRGGVAFGLYIGVATAFIIFLNKHEQDMEDQKRKHLE